MEDLMENLRRVTATEFFRELVTEAMVHQHVQAAELTEFYVVSLLAGFLNRRVDDDKSLGVKFLEALNYGGSQQRNGLRFVGDVTLFVSGYFSDSLNRKLVDRDYYVAMGEQAYGELGRTRDPLAEVFVELSDKFMPFVDVLQEVRSQTRIGTKNQDLLRHYELCLAGSKFSTEFLRRHGINPIVPARKPRVQ